MALLCRAAGLFRLALRTPWAALRLLSSTAGGELPADKPGRRVDLEALRRERALRPPAERARVSSARPGRHLVAPTREQLQLNKELQACASAEAVLALVSSRLAVLNEVNAATALVTLARRASTSEAASLSSDARFAQLLDASASCFGNMSSQELSNALYAFGQLGITPPSNWLERFWHASALKLGAYIPQELSITLYGCGQLGITPPAVWLQRFWQGSAPKLGDCLPQHLANMWYACSQLCVLPPDDWLQRYWDASATLMPTYGEQDIANTMYACGQLGIAPPPRWQERFWEASLDAFKPQGFANTIHACGKLGLKPPAGWMSRFWEASGAKLADFTTQNLSNTLYACGQLGIMPHTRWLERFWAASGAKLDMSDPQAFSNILYTSGRLDTMPPAAWLQRYWTASDPKLGDFIPQNLGNTLYACSQLGIKPPESWLLRFWHVSASLLHTFSEQDFSNTIYACGQLGITPPAPWLEGFSQSIEPALPGLDQQAICNVAFSLAMLQLWELPLWPSLWARLSGSLSRNVEAWTADDHMNARQLYQTYTAAAVERPGLLPAPSPELLVAARQSWVDGLTTDAGPSSRLHNAVSACLTQMGVAHANERWCERAERIIDIAIEGTTPVALEVDGPSHFLQDGRQDGSTMMRNRMLAAHGWRVVVVDFRLWIAQKTPEQREAYLRSLLADA
jgi:hypothetical protein